jgi:hypothetical protein
MQGVVTMWRKLVESGNDVYYKFNASFLCTVLTQKL